ncbi:MAG TPA: two-component regulator propeller domain-containing protein, partial [Verrucomicrobiae bacterium]
MIRPINQPTASNWPLHTTVDSDSTGNYSSPMTHFDASHGVRHSPGRLASHCGFFKQVFSGWFAPGLNYILRFGLGCLGAFLFASASAQDASFNVRLWQAENGLPHNIVQAITQTHDGYLWVGTREGLARFDGERFQIIPLIPGVLQPSILCLQADKDGSLWIGAEIGLFHFHDGLIDRVELPDKPSDTAIFEIHEDPAGGIWFETSHQIFIWQKGKIEQRAKFRYEKQPFCLDKAGQVWLFDNQIKPLDAGSHTNYVLKTGSLPRTARSLYRDPDGVFWIGDSSSGLVELKDGVARRFDRAEGRPGGFISIIFRDSAGNLWIGSYAGLSRFAAGVFTDLYAPDEASYRIYAIYEDKEQNLWVGSEEGLARLTPKRIKTITKKDGLSLNNVVTVCPSRDGSVWISSWGGGLNHWVNGKISSLNKSDGLSSDFIMAMTEGHDGSLWAGADYGGALNCIRDGKITTYGPAQGYVVNPGAANTALFEDVHGGLWLGAREGLLYWNGKEFKNCAGMNNKKINALCGGSNDTMWIGTDYGLMQWDGQKFKNMAADPLLHVSILSLYEDADHTLWIGTRRHGLVRLQSGTTTGFTSAQGLFSDSIYAVLEDERKNLWLDSSRGIFRVNKKQLEAVAIGRDNTIDSISYSKADGVLISGQYQDVTQPAAGKSEDGRLWFRTTQGVTVVDPEKISLNMRPPPVVIQEIIADKKMAKPAFSRPEAAGKLTLSPGRGELEIHYAALSFSAPEKNQYRYKLQGVDTTWVEAGTRHVAFYNNLKPGQYDFCVTACNNDGLWNEVGASVTLVLLPHFWQTDWFLFLLVLSLVGIVGGISRYVTRRRMHRRMEILERQNAVEKERTRIARDMHDELGAKLTSISFQGAMARRRLDNPVEAEQQIGKMSEMARELILSLDQIVWAVDPKNDTLESLAAYLCRHTSEFLENSPLQCEFQIPP